MKRATWLVLVLGLGGLAWMVLGPDAPGGLVGNANVLGGVAGVAGAVLAWWSLRPHRPAAEEDGQTVERLAAEVLRFWEGEAKARRITTPVPAAVQWHWATPDVAARPGEVQSDVLTTGVVTSLRTELYQRLRPPARLVVLGGPGSGKTTAMMLLLIDILQNRAPGSAQPVPVWLTLGGWNPETTSLLEWAGATLARDYLGADPRDRRGSQRGEQLLRARRVALFLDGLDELPYAQRIAALSAVDRETGTLQVVLTSRSAEYRQTVEATRLWSTAVIEMLPVGPAHAAAFLLAEQLGPRRAAWQVVTEHMRAEPDSVVALTLSSPLALSLARDAYARANPARLLDFPAAAQLRRHLLLRTLALAYPDPAEQAHAVHWLQWIAGRMIETRDLRWWDIPRWWAGQRRPLRAGTPTRRWWDFPRWWARQPSSLFVAAVALLAVAGLCTSAAVHRLGFGGRLGATAASVLLGTVFVAVVWDLSFRLSADRPPLRLAPRWPRRLWLLGVPAAVRAVPGVPHASTVALLCSAFLLPTLLAFAWTAPLAAAGAATPGQAFAADRRRTVVIGTVSAVTTGALVTLAWHRTGSPAGPDAALLVLGSGLCAGLILSAGATLGLWLTQVSAGVRGRRVDFLRLLRTAADRQVLRQAGSVYQFRHADLQDLLTLEEMPAALRGADRPPAARTAQPSDRSVLTAAVARVTEDLELPGDDVARPRTPAIFRPDTGTTVADTGQTGSGRSIRVLCRLAVRGGSRGHEALHELALRARFDGDAVTALTGLGQMRWAGRDRAGSWSLGGLAVLCLLDADTSLTRRRAAQLFAVLGPDDQRHLLSRLGADSVGTAQPDRVRAVLRRQQEAR
nr:hypothetical protein [uncultured Actinoplanes sp.]